MTPLTWLMPLVGAIGMPKPTADEVAATATCCGLALADLPEDVWSHDALMEAMRTFTRWPSVAEIRRLLMEHRAPAVHMHFEPLREIGRPWRVPRALHVVPTPDRGRPL